MKWIALRAAVLSAWQSVGGFPPNIFGALAVIRPSKVTLGAIARSRSEFKQEKLTVLHMPSPNHSIERTRNGMPCLAVISFWAKRGMPLRAAHVKR